MADDARTDSRADASLQRFWAALVGLILGQLAGNHSVTLAKLYVYLRDPSAYYSARIAEVSVQAIGILALGGLVFGGWATKRGWASFEQVVTSMVIATVVATFTILDQSLPVVSGDARLPLGETSYYLGWIFGLLFVPALLVTRPGAGFAEWIRRGGGLVVVAAATGLAGLAAGAAVEETATFILESLSGEFCLNDCQRFWMARPITINAICGMYVVVAFSVIWWQELYRSAMRTSLWVAGISVFAAVYSGIYGWFIYAPAKAGAPWQFAAAFGAVPVVTVVVVFAAYRIGRRDSEIPAVGWPVSGLFWWLSPLGLSVGFAACAGLGFGPLAIQGGATGEQLVVLTAAHAINGFVFGLVLRTMTWSVRLIPEVRRRPLRRDG